MKGLRFRISLLALVVPFTAILLGACDRLPTTFGGRAPDPYYLAGNEEDKQIMRDLFTLLEKENSPGEEQFSVIREIADELLRQREYQKLTNFLTSWVNQHPEDPYNAYLLLMCAYVYIQQDAAPVALLYFDRIVKNFPDLSVRGESIHMVSLNKLIELATNKEQRVWYYRELISRFPDKIDLGVAYFMLGQSYESIGEWDEAIKAYTKFLPYYSSSIPGFPDAFGYAKNLTDFNNSPKDWSFETLDALVQAVKTALDMGSSARLRQYMAKVNFFAKSWEQEDSDVSSIVEFNLSAFMTGNRIRYAANLDAGSNANEAYLRTWGWSQRISTWYLYFRKINFPADPESHGRWEWAGVYYGEKL